MGTIDTGNVTGRRELHFTDLAQLDADARALAEGDAAGKLHRLGNWSLGQALGHLAAWTNFGFDGYPMKVPFYIKAMIRPMKGRLLRGPIPAGKCIPNVAGGTFGTEAISTEEGLKKFLAADAGWGGCAQWRRIRCLGR